MMTEPGSTARQMPARHFLLVWLLVLCACSRDVGVSTVLDDSGGLRPGDKVYLASREVGFVETLESSQQTPGVTVELGLYPEHAELVQANAVAYVPFKSPPMVVLLNPTESAAPVSPGGRLKGLSPLEAAIWQASDAAATASDLVEQFARTLDGYLGSEDWARTRTKIEAEIAALAHDYRATAERIAEELRRLMESLEEEEKDGHHARNEEVTAIEREIARLEAEGHAELAASLRRLLEQIRAYDSQP